MKGFLAFIGTLVLIGAAFASGVIIADKDILHIIKQEAPGEEAAKGLLDHVVVTPSAATLNIGQTQQFSSAAYDRYDTEIRELACTWDVDAGGDSIDSNGVFTATVAGTFTVKAETTQGAITRSDTATVTVNPASNQAPNTPSNASPANGATGVSLTPTMQSSAFSDPDAGDTHAASKWRITSTAGDYSTRVYDSDTDSSNKTQIAIPSGNLSYSTTYYWHVRHQDNNGAWSSWSAETSFTTAVSALYVGPGETYTTIQAAVDAASPGNTIIVRDGTYTENVDVNKSLTIQSENGATSTTVQAANSSDHVFHVTADNVTIIGFTVTGANTNYSAGIYLGISFGNGVDYCTISNNTASNNYGGIRLQDSNNNTITNNTANSNSDYGIMLANSANNNIIAGNTTSNNNSSGIYLFSGASNNTISGNTSSGQWRGIYLFTGSSSIVSGNTVSRNTLSSNNYGIDVYGSSNNTIYLNNFSGNPWANVRSQAGSTNTWYSPTTISYTYNSTTYNNYLGNYWSDYSGADANGDGIGDTAYNISGDTNNDDYPLMQTSNNY